jgi:hypothetical protein
MLNLCSLRVCAVAVGLLLAGLPASTPSMAQGTKAVPAITVPAIVLIEPMVETSFPIQVGPIESLPRNCFVRVKGLPTQAVFSDGHVVSPGTWALPIAGLDELKLTVPLATQGRTELQLTLMAIDGTMLADSKVTLAVTAGALSAPGVAAAPPAARQPSSASLGPPTGDLAPQPSPPLQRVGPAPPPTMKAEDRERAVMFLARAKSILQAGDVASARQLFQRAADAGLGEAAIAMGSTYDPVELDRLGVRGLKGDPEAARKWYERARVLGAPGAEERLRRVGSP